MRFYVITAIITIIVLIATITYRLDIWNQKDLPYDDEQNGLDDHIIINFSHVVAENTPKGLAAIKFAELVKEKSNGDMIVQIYPNGIMYNDDNELKALKEGDIQMIAPTISKMTDALPSWQVLDLPFIFENDEQVYQALHGDLSEKLLQELNSINVHGLTFWNNGFKQMAAQTTPLLNVADFTDLSIRSMPSEILKEQFTLLKAKPVVTTFNDLYAASQNNQVLAQENTISNIYSKGYYTLQPHITLSNHGILAYALMMNEEFWDSLNDEQQQIIEEAIEEIGRWQHEQAITINDGNLQLLKETTEIQLYTLSDSKRQQWIDALQPIYRSYEKLSNKGYLEQLHDEINGSSN